MKRKFRLPGVFSALTVFVSFVMFQFMGWFPLKYWEIAGPRPFVDLESVLGSADCYRKIGFEIYAYPIGHPCAYNYGSALMRVISAIGVGKAQTLIIGLAFILIFSVFIGVAVNSLKLEKLKTFAFLFLVVFSPPVLLLFERGNLDIFIYFLILGAALSNAAGFSLLSLTAILASALFKFYSIVLFVFAASFHQLKHRIVLLGIAVLAAFKIYSDFKRGPGFINTEWTSFGAPVAGLYLKYLGITIPYFWSLILGLLLLAIALMAILLISRNRPLLSIIDIDKIFSNSYFKQIYIFSLVTHITCYILGMSFDYRLIFLATSTVLLVYGSTLSLIYRQIVAVLTLVILWTSVDLQLLQPLGDMLIGVITAISIIQIFRYWFFYQNIKFTARSLRFVRFLLRSQA